MGLAICRRLADARQPGRGARPRRRRRRGGGRATSAPRAAPPLAAKVDVSDRAAVDEAIGDRARRARTGRDHGHERRARRVRDVHRHHAPNRGTASSRSTSPARSTACRPRSPTCSPPGGAASSRSRRRARSRARPRMAHYVASKGGVIGLTKALAVEYAANGHHGEHDPARVHRHADGAPRRSRAATFRASTRSRRARPCAGPARPTTSRPRARSCAPTKRATSPARSSASTAAGTCDRRRRASRRFPVEQWSDDERAALRSGFPRAAPRILSTGPDALPASNVLCTLMHHPRSPGPFLAYNARAARRSPRSGTATAS